MFAYLTKIKPAKKSRSLTKRLGGMLVLGFHLGNSFALGCATARGPAPSAENYVSAEQAVIIWDDEHKVEHFIRQAEIHTGDPNLGFLVPTPQTPTLVEANANIFRLAEEVGRPKLVPEVISHRPAQIVERVALGPAQILGLAFTRLLSGMSGMMPPDLPTVVSEKDIAGYHAVILAADDASGLGRWLKSNGYVWTPELETWAKPYVAKKWKITAFKLTKAQSGIATPIVTRAIRMSFAADRPFFPYSEPEDKQRASKASPFGRTLRVAVLAPQRMNGSLGRDWWPGDLFYAGPPAPQPGSSWKTEDWLKLAHLEGQMTLPATLTYWRDKSNPRPGTSDLVFSPSQVQSSMRKVEINYSIPARHVLDWSDVEGDIAALLLVIILPGAPIYCGWRLLRITRQRAIGVPVKQPRLFQALQQISGAVIWVMGLLYAGSCLLVAAFVQIYAEKALPGMPLPSIDTPPVPFLIAIFLLALTYCGVAMFRSPYTKKAISRPRSLSRVWDYLMAAASMLIGAAFALGIAMALLINLTD